VKSSPHRALPIFTVDRSAAIPLHKQIYQGYALHPAWRSAPRRPDFLQREFAVELRISRFPVLNGYAQLLAEGYFESRVGAGTFVSCSLPEQLMSVSQPAGQAASSPSGPRPVSRRSSLYPGFSFTARMRGWGAFGVHQPRSITFLFQSGPASSGDTVETLLPAQSTPSIREVRAIRKAIGNYLRTARE